MYISYQKNLAGAKVESLTDAGPVDKLPIEAEVTMATTKKTKMKKSFKSSVVLIPPEENWKQINDIRCVHDKGFKRWMAHINLVYPFISDDNEGVDFAQAADMITDGLGDVEPFQVALTKDSFGYFRHSKSCTLWLKPLVVGLEEEPVESNMSGPNEEQLSEIKQKQEKRRQKSASSNKEDENYPIDELFSEHSQDGATAEPPQPEAEDTTGSRSEEGHKYKKKKKTKKTAPLTKQNFHPSVLTLHKTLEDIYPELTDLRSISEHGFQPHLSLGQFSPGEVEEMMEHFKERWRDEVFTVKEIYLISRADFDDPFHVRQTVKLGRNK